MIRRMLLVLLLLMLPLGARAELPLVYPAETVLSVVPLTETQQRLVAHLYAPILDGERKIELPEGTRYDDVGPAMQSLMMDYPELFHLHRSYTVTYWQNAPETAIAVNPQYRMDAGEAVRVRQQLYEAAQQLIQADRTAVGLHDALVARVTYGGDTELRHTAAAALLQGQATCEGYTQALTLLYRMAGIPCGLVSGSGTESATGQQVSHAWNIAYLGGYTFIDATWDDQERAGLNTRWYFGLSTRQLAADHQPDAALNVPPCGEQANWHLRCDRYADETEDVYRALRNLVVYGEPVNLRVTDAALYAAVSADPGSVLEGYNAWCAPGEAFYGSYSYLSCDAQGCFILDRVAGE
ncbi:MAG: hypothetical protein IJA77_07350 [Clostridia bacterium]|nr:hypothetical protein [Clostridia bacterium]